MGIDLTNINISLDQFNAASRGEYNIGQLKLSEDGNGVYRCTARWEKCLTTTGCQSCNLAAWHA